MVYGGATFLSPTVWVIWTHLAPKAAVLCEITVDDHGLRTAQGDTKHLTCLSSLSGDHDIAFYDFKMATGGRF